MKTITITQEEEIEAIIGRCNYCMVGLVDEHGHPYVLPMNFAYHHRTIYLHSGPDGSKVSMAKQRPDVCITFCEGHELVYMHQQVACSYSMKSRSVVCRGTVQFIDDLEEKRRALALLMQQYTDRPFEFAEPSLRGVAVWQVAVSEMTCKSFGLRPSEL